MGDPHQPTNALPWLVFKCNYFPTDNEHNEILSTVSRNQLLIMLFKLDWETSVYYLANTLTFLIIKKKTEQKIVKEPTFSIVIS